MKVLLAVHGYPPELVGGTENSTQALARGLALAGHAVTVVAGSIRAPAPRGPPIPAGPEPSARTDDQGITVSQSTDRDPRGGAPVRLLRLHRPDLYADHWHKSASPAVSRAFRRILREVRPDVVHVQHWIRLSRDLVLCAAREGVPAVVTLNDAWISCLVAFRVRPDTRAPCDVPIAAHPCLACAAHLPPKTPWVTREAGHMALGERQRDLLRELELARACIAPSRAHARALERFLGLAEGGLGASVIAPAMETREELLARPALALPPPGAPTSQPLLLGAWGHLSPHKGIELLLDAARLLGDSPRVELRFAGAQAQAGYLDRLRERARGVSANFHGAYSPGELATHPVTAVHAFASATIARESYALVLEEARALGLPALLPRTELFEERAEPGTHFYEPGDARSLADAMRALATDRRLLERLQREALASRGRARGDPVREHLELYARAVSLGAPRVGAESWFEARMGQEALSAWDRALSARSAAELGLFEP
jgi:glycosyltransferase involved in cell wall biosynthesis